MSENNIEIRKSNISGKGVFAKELIKKGERICFMDGELMSLDQMIKKVDEGKEDSSDPLGIDDEIYVDLNELPRSINHSCNPCAFIKGKNELIALRDIEKDEEITFDYSTTMNDNKKKIEKSGGGLWTMKCKCGSKNCRRIIDQFKTLPYERKEFYIKNKLVPDFIISKFLNNKN